MINVIVPIVDNAEKFKEFISRETTSGIKFYVGIKQKLASVFYGKYKNLELHVYADNCNKEEIINSLHTCKMKKGKILIVRRPLNEQEFQALTNSEADITTLVGKHGKFFNWLKELGTKIVQKFFAFSFFEDISAIYYGENMFELMSVCANVSMASRVNKYVGVEIRQIETTSKPVKKEYNRLVAALLCVLWNVLLFGSITGGVLVCVFANVNAMAVLLVIFWIVMAMLIWFVGMINFTRMIVVGNLRYGRAEEVTIIKQK